MGPARKKSAKKTKGFYQTALDVGFSEQEAKEMQDEVDRREEELVDYEEEDDVRRDSPIEEVDEYFSSTPSRSKRRFAPEDMGPVMVNGPEVTSSNSRRASSSGRKSRRAANVEDAVYDLQVKVCEMTDRVNAMEGSKNEKSEDSSSLRDVLQAISNLSTRQDQIMQDIRSFNESAMRLKEFRQTTSDRLSNIEDKLARMNLWRPEEEEDGEEFDQGGDMVEDFGEEPSPSKENAVFRREHQPLPSEFQIPTLDELLHPSDLRPSITPQEAKPSSTMEVAPGSGQGNLQSNPIPRTEVLVDWSTLQGMQLTKAALQGLTDRNVILQNLSTYHSIRDNQGRPANLSMFVSNEAVIFLDFITSQHGNGDWRNWSAGQLRDFLIQYWKGSSGSSVDGTASLHEKSIRNLRLPKDHDGTSHIQMDAYCADVLQVNSQYGVDSDSVIAEPLRTYFIKDQWVQTKNPALKFISSRICSIADKGPVTWTAVLKEINHWATEQARMSQIAGMMGIDRSSLSQPLSPRTSGGGKPASKGGSGSEPTSKPPTLPQCVYCGRRHPGDCFMIHHPESNRSSASWEQSEIGKRYLAAGKTCLDPSRDLAGHPVTYQGQEKAVDPKKGKAQEKSSGRTPVKSKCLQLCAIPEEGCEIDLTIVFTRREGAQVEKTGTPQKVRALLDTGASSRNYLSEQLLQRLKKDQLGISKLVRRVVEETPVCALVGTNPCVHPKVEIELNVKLNLRNSNTVGSEDDPIYKITFLVVPFALADVDAVIGLPTIREYDLTQRFRTLFVDAGRENREKEGKDAESRVTEVSQDVTSSFIRPSQDQAVEMARVHRDELLTLGEESLVDSDIFWREGLDSELMESGRKQGSQKRSVITLAAIRQLKETMCNLPRNKRRRLSRQWQGTPQGFRLSDEQREQFFCLPRKQRRALIRKPQVLAATRTSLPDDELPVIAGTDDIHQRTRELTKEFAHVFRRKVQQEPAKIKPMVLKFEDEKAWKVRANTRPARPLSPGKEETLKEEVRKLEESTVIQKSQAVYHSQVLLVPKPNGKWRFCIDYRALNDTLEGMGWPIPNITYLVRKIGQKRPKWFAVLDLTSGYHQVLLAEESRPAAAFITPYGVYEPVRISMGLKAAPAYFQQQMQTEVLGGLIGEACEVYIDDIIIYGADEDEFLSNMRRVLERLSEFNVTINPDKAKIAVQQVEAVGHVIDQYGISMSEDKIRKVMDFPLPKLGKDLKRFLGMANYFRPHIHRYSEKVRILEQMICNYKSTRDKKIVWTEETTAAFRHIQECIGSCPKLFFVDETLPIILETDASDYGIGAFLFQQRENGDREPIAFMSRSLQGAQKNWTTIEKECFAIYSALREWEYLLRDAVFTIRTDHNNLRYLNANTPKVVRWKLAIQEYNFFVEYIQGPKNEVADALSRIQRDDALEGEERHVEPPQSDTAEQVHTLLATWQTSPVHVLARMDSRNHIEQMQALQPGRTEHEEDMMTSEHQDVREKLLDELKSRIQADYTLPVAAQDMTDKDVAELVVARTLAAEPMQLPEHHVRDVMTVEHAAKIARVHNGIRGHHGLERTVDLLRKEHQGRVWPYMRRHVRSFIDHCPFCQKMRNIQSVIQTRPFTTASYQPMSRINVDTIGPLPEDEQGNCYIIVFIDCFSRFCELYAVPSTEATHCARCLINFVGRYGAPRYILSDRGRQFVNEMIEEVSSLVASNQIFSMAYSKEENAIVERANAEVMRHVRGIVFDTKVKKNWSTILPLAQRIMNATIKESTGVSPARLIFGNSIDLDGGLMFHKETVSSDRISQPTPALRQYIDRLLSLQRTVLECAQRHQLAKDLEHVQQEEKEGKEQRFALESFVLLRYPLGLGNQHRPPTKLHTRWQGPFRVIGMSGDQYTLQNLVTMKTSQHHGRELAPFKWNAAITKPEQVAQTDQDEFVIERIMEHKGDLSKKSTLRFRVRWLGYQESDDTWEPWSNLSKTEALHAYLRAIGQARHIPKQFQLGMS